MKALLCTVPLGVGSLRGEAQLPVVPKVGITALIHWMQKHGYTEQEYDYFDIDMLDPDDATIRDYMRKCRPDVVGLSAVVSTSYLQVKRISRIIREECPDAWIVMGGYLAASYDVVLRKTDVELCVEGDGEIAWVQFLDYVKKYGRERNYDELRKIVGMVFLKDGETNPHCGGLSIPPKDMEFPDYDLLALGLKTKPSDINNYFRPGLGSDWFNHDPRAHEKTRKPNIACIWTTKGCVATCTFCQRGTEGYRVYDLEKLDKHLELLRNKYNVGFISISDENFGSNKKHAYEVGRLMTKHDMLWIGGGVRCTNILLQDTKFYHDHGCTGMKLGVESGSQKILDLMEKKFTVKRVRDGVDYCIDAGLLSPLAVMAGYPGETDETIKQTADFCARVALKKGLPPAACGIEIFYAMPLPDTPLYEYGKTTGMIARDPDGEEEYLASVSDRGVEKMNYINLNGSNLKTIIYWDILLRVEASRVYYREVDKTAAAKPAAGVMAPEAMGAELRKALPWSYSDISQKYIQKITKPRAFARFVTMIRRKSLAWFVSSPTVARLPSGPVDFVARNVVWWSFLADKYYRRVRRSMGIIDKNVVLPKLFEDPPPPPKPLTDEEITGLGPGVIRSLHSIVLMRNGKIKPTAAPAVVIPVAKETVAA